MDVSILLAEQILSLTLMGISGYILRRAGLLDAAGCRGLTVVCLYLCVPCTLFYSFQTRLDAAHMTGFLYALLATAAIHLVFFGVMYGIRRVKPLTGLEACSVIYSNCGNLVIPLVAGVFGQEYVFYTTAYLLVQNVLLWTHGIFSVAERRESSPGKIFLNPCILSMVLGMAFMVTGLPLPGVADQALSGISACLGPISMLVVGSLMAEIRLKKSFLNFRALGIAFLRLFIFPFLGAAAAFAVWRFFPVRIDPAICLIVTLGASGPAATTLTQMAQLYDRNPGYASALNVITTFGSVASMPLAVLAAQMMQRFF